MLMIDDNMYKLAKMQESLLKVATGDRRYHLDNYIKNITMIDAKAYEELVRMMKDASKYNQTLEDELLYLEKIRKTYDDMMELQIRFRRVCEQYGSNNLVLSDMSLLNIDYVDNRISTISGYLNNINNIEHNKKKLESLNEQLVNEEKKRDFLSKKIEIFEKKLRDDFVHASFKQVVFGKLETFDIISEYSKLGYDVLSLLDNEEELNNKYNIINAQCADIGENYEAAKFCYDNLLNEESKKLVEEVEREFYLVKYKYIMLKILKLLSQKVDNYDLAKVKRETLTELINNRNVCLSKLGITNPLNLLDVVGIDLQLKEISSLADSIKMIHSIRREISELTNRTEEMINENNNYLISLSDTKEMIVSKVGLNDFDITTFDDIVTEEVTNKKMVLGNQVTKVKGISSDFKLIIAKQKAKGVIDRIYNMNFNKPINNSYVESEKEIPELVIGPKEVITPRVDDVIFDDVRPEEVSFSNNDEEILVIEPDLVVFPIKKEKEEAIFFDKNSELNVIYKEKVETPMTDIFETTTPFVAPVMFSDRTDNIMMPRKEEELIPKVKEEIVLPVLEDSSNVNQSDEMPDAFWTMENNGGTLEQEDKSELSFDEQINALLAETREENNLRRR